MIGIGTALGVSIFFLYTRRKKWANPKLRWIICWALFIIGLIGLLNTTGADKDQVMLYWGLCVPIIYYSLDRLLRQLSFRIYDRDFVLWLQWSDEIDSSFGADNPHVKPFDKVFSIGLLIMIVATTIIGAIISNK